jgi:hypothetical protein
VSNAWPVGDASATDFLVRLSGGGTFHGPINVAPRVAVDLDLVGTLGNDPRRFSNVFTFAADSQVKLDGDVRVTESSVVANSNLTVGQLIFGAALDGIYTNTISGTGNIDVTRKLIWNGGRIATTGVVTVKPSAILQLDGAGSSPLATVLDGTTLIHQGTVSGSELSQFTLSHGAVFRNEGTLTENSGIPSGEGSGRIDNYGTWTSTGLLFGYDLRVDVPFVNYGTMRIDTNYGNNFWRFSDLTNNGMLIVAPHYPYPYKLVEVRGDYNQAAGAALRVELTNTNPLYVTPLLAGTIDIDGQAHLAGKLQVDFVKYDPTQAFTDHPAAGESYPLLTFASRTGDFAQMTSLDLANGFDYNFVFTEMSLTAVAKAAT